MVQVHRFWQAFITLSSAVSLGASIVCRRIPGLSPKQRTICQSHPDAMIAVGEGIKTGFSECRYQFRNNRWNCSTSGVNNSPIGHVSPSSCRETAFMYAVRSAAVAYTITHACSLGNLMGCGCDRSKLDGKASDNSWKWGGCSADVRYGLKFARIFMDSREIEENTRSLMNLHNNRAGRKALKDSISTECKCHGVSGSCTTKTCWTTLSRFRLVGDKLTLKYLRAKQVDAVGGNRARKPTNLKLKDTTSDKPRQRDIVFLHDSPNFCEYDIMTGSLGTRGRACNKTSNGSDGCESMCCGRGYNSSEQMRVWKCDCKFHWCCQVTCRQCSERTEKFTCK